MTRVSTVRGRAWWGFGGEDEGGVLRIEEWGCVDVEVEGVFFFSFGRGGDFVGVVGVEH